VSTNDERLGDDPSIPVISVYGYLLGDAFVGFGTRLGNGCTTGHGICGLARLSKRSIVAVCTFMASAFCTAALTAPDNQAFSKGTEFLRTDTVPTFFHRWLGFGISMPIVLSTFFALYYNLVWKKSSQENSDGASKFRESNVTMAESTNHPEEETSVDIAVDDPENPSNDSISTSGEGEQQASNDDQPLKCDDGLRKLLPAMLSGAILRWVWLSAK
jgi:hypothetical protein